jgi:hypothetical protein
MHSRRSLLSFYDPSVILTFTDSQLSDTYAVWQHKAEQAGNVTFLLGHPVIHIISRTKKRTVLEYRILSSGELRTAGFDSLILATDAASALTILGKQASWLERQVLGGVKYLHDLTVTHMDPDYMRKVPPFLCPLPSGPTYLTWH